MFGGLDPFLYFICNPWLISLLLANGLGRAVVACVVLLDVLLLLAAFAIT